MDTASPSTPPTPASAVSSAPSSPTRQQLDEWSRMVDALKQDYEDLWEMLEGLERLLKEFDRQTAADKRPAVEKVFRRFCLCLLGTCDQNGLQYPSWMKHTREQVPHTINAAFVDTLTSTRPSSGEGFCFPARFFRLYRSALPGKYPAYAFPPPAPLYTRSRELVLADFRRPFDGHGHSNLNQHIQDQMRTFDHEKQYGRITPMTQSSGTGKSRNTDQLLRTTHLGVQLSFRAATDTTAWPPRDALAADVLCNWLTEPDEKHESFAVTKSADLITANGPVRCLKVAISCAAFATATDTSAAAAAAPDASSSKASTFEVQVPCTFADRVVLAAWLEAFALELAAHIRAALVPGRRGAEQPPADVDRMDLDSSDEQLSSSAPAASGTGTTPGPRGPSAPGASPSRSAPQLLYNYLEEICDEPDEPATQVGAEGQQPVVLTRKDRLLFNVRARCLQQIPTLLVKNDEGMDEFEKSACGAAFACLQKATLEAERYQAENGHRQNVDNLLYTVLALDEVSSLGWRLGELRRLWHEVGGYHNTRLVLALLDTNSSINALVGREAELYSSRLTEGRLTLLPAFYMLPLNVAFEALSEAERAPHGKRWHELLAQLPKKGRPLLADQHLRVNPRDENSSLRPAFASVSLFLVQAKLLSADPAVLPSLPDKVTMNEMGSDGDLRDKYLAALGRRLPLTFIGEQGNVAFDLIVNRQVSSHLRTVRHIRPVTSTLTTGTPPEPLLSVAAADLFRMPCPGTLQAWSTAIQVLHEKRDFYGLTTGRDGEEVSCLLFDMAADFAAVKRLPTDPELKRMARKRGQTMQPISLWDWLSQMFGSAALATAAAARAGPDPAGDNTEPAMSAALTQPPRVSAQAQQSTKVNEAQSQQQEQKAKKQKQTQKQDETETARSRADRAAATAPPTAFEKRARSAWLTFTTFVPLKKQTKSFSPEQLARIFIDHMAVVGSINQPSWDMVIPVYLDDRRPDDSTIFDVGKMSLLAIQIKNRKDPIPRSEKVVVPPAISRPAAAQQAPASAAQRTAATPAQRLDAPGASTAVAWQAAAAPSPDLFTLFVELQRPPRRRNPDPILSYSCLGSPGDGTATSSDTGDAGGAAIHALQAQGLAEAFEPLLRGFSDRVRAKLEVLAGAERPMFLASDWEAIDPKTCDRLEGFYTLLE